MNYDKEINEVIELEKNKLGIGEPIVNIKISKLGIGENNYNLLVVVNNKFKLVFRIAMRDYIEKNMELEHESIQNLPKGFGPKSLHFDNSKKLIPRVYSIQTFIEGKHIKNWSKKHLEMHAKKLAMLHKQKYDFCGKLHKKEKTYSIYERFLNDIKDFKKDTPKIFENENIKKFIPKIKKYLQSNNHLFTSMKQFSLTHTDLVLPNIIFTKNDVKYIDWEWTKYGDNAYDVAILFDQEINQPPWKIKLTGEKLDYYLNTYLKYHPDKTLKERVKVYNNLLRGTDLLFFNWKLHNYDKDEFNDLPKEHYQKQLDNLVKLLKRKYQNN